VTLRSISPTKIEILCVTAGVIGFSSNQSTLLIRREPDMTNSTPHLELNLSVVYLRSFQHFSRLLRCSYFWQRKTDAGEIPLSIALPPRDYERRNRKCSDTDQCGCTQPADILNYEPHVRNQRHKRRGHLCASFRCGLGNPPGLCFDRGGFPLLTGMRIESQ